MNCRGSGGSWSELPWVCWGVLVFGCVVGGVGAGGGVFGSRVLGVRAGGWLDGVYVLVGCGDEGAGGPGGGYSDGGFAGVAGDDAGYVP